MWLYNIQDDDNMDPLQEWVLENLKPEVEWMQGIQVLDACQSLAENPEESPRHLPRAPKDQPWTWVGPA